VAAGEAVVLPPDVVHSAWTQLTPMRAIVVEFATPDADVGVLGIDGAAAGPNGDEPSGPQAHSAAESSLAEGGLVPPPLAMPPRRRSTEEEPW
jgi:hypothetical protein